MYPLFRQDKQSRWDFCSDHIRRPGDSLLHPSLRRYSPLRRTCYLQKTSESQIIVQILDSICILHRFHITHKQQCNGNRERIHRQVHSEHHKKCGKKERHHHDTQIIAERLRILHIRKWGIRGNFVSNFIVVSKTTCQGFYYNFDLHFSVIFLFFPKKETHPIATCLSDMFKMKLRVLS